MYSYNLIRALVHQGSVEDIHLTVQAYYLAAFCLLNESCMESAKIQLQTNILACLGVIQHALLSVLLMQKGDTQNLMYLLSLADLELPPLLYFTSHKGKAWLFKAASILCKQCLTIQVPKTLGNAKLHGPQTRCTLATDTSSIHISAEQTDTIAH